MRVRGIERESDSRRKRNGIYCRYRDTARVINSETGRVIDSES